MAMPFSTNGECGVNIEEEINKKQKQQNNVENEFNGFDNVEDGGKKKDVVDNDNPFILGNGAACEDNLDDKKGEEDYDGDDKHNEDEDEIDNGLSYASTIKTDKGWAWMVVLSCHLTQFLVLGLSRTFGVFIQDFQEWFHIGNKELGVVAGMNTMLVFGSGLLVHVLVVKFTARRVVLVGSLLISVGLISTVFVTNVNWIYVTYGFVVGLGSGFCFHPSFVLVGQSFQKYRGIAYGIAMCGAGFGTFTVPLLARVLIREYALQGCLLILGAVMLNLCISGVLLPPPRRKRKTPKKNDCPETQELQSSPGRVNKPGDKVKEGARVIEWSVLLKPRFLLHLVSTCPGLMCNINAVFMLPVYGTDCGLTRDMAALLLSIIGTFDLVSRLTFPIFTDLVRCRKRLAMAVALVIMGVLNMAVPFMTDLPSLVAYAVLSGAANGSCISMIPVLCAEVNGPDKMGTSFGLTALIAGVWVMIGPPMCGAIKDSAGTWDMAFVTVGVIAFAASIAAFVEIFIFIDRRKTSKNEE